MQDTLQQIPFEEDELLFLKKKEQQERMVFYRAAIAFMGICFVVPFGVAWLRAFMGSENPFSLLYYFSAVAFLLIFSGTGIYWSYRNTLQKIRKDIRQGIKIVEKVNVTRKKYMPSNDSCHLYISSVVRISIEVAREDYDRWEEGDELSIEYTPHARVYFGYF